ncbi:hypothetical protein HBM95_11435 [Enterobacter asburiae]|nr:hypothetical protein [Enterobacter asburiae]
MYKFVFKVAKPVILIFCLAVSLPALATGGTDSPSITLHISHKQYSAMLGQTDYAFPDEVALPLADFIIGDKNPPVSVQVVWTDSCTPLNGTTGLNIRAQGIKDLKEIADSLQIPDESALIHSTRLWFTVNKSAQPMTPKQQYECDLLGSQSWSNSFNKKPVTRLILSFDTEKSACSISTLGSLRLPPVSTNNKRSFAELPVTVTCNNFDSPPNVYLTLKGGQGSNGDSLYDDSNVMMEALYNETGQRWKADGEMKYEVGEVDSVKTITPIISSALKERAHAGQYSTSATITLDVE